MRIEMLLLFLGLGQSSLKVDVTQLLLLGWKWGPKLWKTNKTPHLLTHFGYQSPSDVTWQTVLFCLSKHVANHLRRVENFVVSGSITGIIFGFGYGRTTREEDTPHRGIHGIAWTTYCPTWSSFKTKLYFPNIPPRQTTNTICTLAQAKFKFRQHSQSRR